MAGKLCITERALQSFYDTFNTLSDLEGKIETILRQSGIVSESDFMIETSSYVPSPGASVLLENSHAKEPELKLRFQIRKSGEDIIVITCKGRIIYRDEVAAFSRTVADLLTQVRHLVLELSEVETMDGAGLGELLSLLTLAKSHGCTLKLVAPSKTVRELLELTHVAPAFEIHGTLNDALPLAHVHAQAV